MQINVNGQSYSRWEDVPAEVRQQLAAVLPDADRNGVPDLFETGALPGGALAQAAVVVNGHSVSSLDQLPPEVRQTLHQVFGWAAPAAGAPPAGAAAPVAGGSWPLQPGQVMLNGVPTTPGEVVEPKKPWWKRIFGG